MTTSHLVCLVDAANRCLAALKVVDVGDRFEGTIAFDDASADIQELFIEFEEILEEQTFSLLDEIESRIDRLNLRIRFEDGTQQPVSDLQIDPITGGVSFRTGPTVNPTPSPPSAVPAANSPASTTGG